MSSCWWSLTLQIALYHASLRTRTAAVIRLPVPVSLSVADGKLQVHQWRHQAPGLKRRVELQLARSCLKNVSSTTITRARELIIVRWPHFAISSACFVDLLLYLPLQCVWHRAVSYCQVSINRYTLIEAHTLLQITRLNAVRLVMEILYYTGFHILV